jgi:2-oxoglutarate ferredoxin oxidoreductase subunit beta
MADVHRYDVPDTRPTWCPGCGNFGIWNAMKAAYASMDLAPHKTAIVCGIGCSGNLSYWINTYVLHSLHGRSIPVAQGIKLANGDLTVIVHAGDGDTYGEGLGHLLHAARRNIDITVFVHDNQVYGLTTGQPSPTSFKGTKWKVAPEGVVASPVTPLPLALLAGATFVGRGFSGANKHLSELMVKAIQHKGFSLVDIGQPCVTFNQVNTWKWWNDHVYTLEETEHDRFDYELALKKAQEVGDKLPIGVLYEVDKPTFDDEYRSLNAEPLAHVPIDNIDVDKLMARHL